MAESISLRLGVNTFATYTAPCMSGHERMMMLRNLSVHLHEAPTSRLLCVVGLCVDVAFLHAPAQLPTRQSVRASLVPLGCCSTLFSFRYDLLWRGLSESVNRPLQVGRPTACKMLALDYCACVFAMHSHICQCNKMV